MEFQIIGINFFIVNFKGLISTVIRTIFINNYPNIVRIYTFIDTDIHFYNLNEFDQFEYNYLKSVYPIKEIAKIINELDDDLKIPFSMFLSGYKYHEIAKILNISLTTVKKRILYAQQELNKKMLLH